MTVPASIDVQLSYTGTGLVKDYTVTFPTYQDSDVMAEVEGPNADDPVVQLVLGTDFTLSGIGRVGHASNFRLVNNGQDWINLTGNLRVGYKLRIRFTNIASQLARLRDLGRYAPVEIERTLDRFALILKSYKIDIGKAITLAGEGEGVSGEFPPLPGNGGYAVIVLPNESGFGYQPFPDGVPPLGDEDSALVRQGGAAVWDDLSFEGYSSAFNKPWSSKGLRDTLTKILNLTYIAPAIAAFSGSSNILREKGDTVAGITLTVNVNKRTNDIARIRFLQGGNVIEDYNPPAETGSGVTTANYTVPFSDNTPFRVEVTDEVTAEGGPSTVAGNLTYNFVYPYYHGAGAPGRTPAQVALMTKDIRNSTATLAKTFNSANGDVYYFAYPASYGALTEIKDENEFNVTGSWTRRTENLTGLDGNPISYYIYESNNPVVAGVSLFTFYR